MTTVKVQSIKDIRNKELLYVVIKNGDREYPISVGQKTYNAVKDIIELEKQSELPLDNKPKK